MKTLTNGFRILKLIRFIVVYEGRSLGLLMLPKLKTHKKAVQKLQKINVLAL